MVHMPSSHSVRPLRSPVYPSPNSPCPCSARRCCKGTVLFVLLGLLSLVLTLQACKAPMDAQGQGGPPPETPETFLPLPPSAGAWFDEGMAAYKRGDYTTAAAGGAGIANGGPPPSPTARLRRMSAIFLAVA